MRDKIYKVILVDDEDDVRGRISGLVNPAWGFEVVGSAGNGSDALDLISSLKPHVVISDIRMPYINGLELAQIIQHEYPTVKVVFITGYGEFDYARQAIDLGVSSYLTKPVSKDDMFQVLLKLKKNLDEEHRERYNQEKILEHYRENLPFIIENYLLSVMMGRHSWREIEFLKNNGVDFDRNSAFLVGFVNLDSDVAPEDALGYEGRKISVRSTIHSILDQRGFRVHSILFNSGIIILIQELETHGLSKKLDQALLEVVQAAEQYLNVRLDMGISRMASTAGDLSRAYEEAVRALDLSTFMNTGRIVHIDQIENNPVKRLQLEREDIKKLEQELRFGTTESISEFVLILKEKISVLSHEQSTDLQLFILKMANILFSAAESLGVDLYETLDKDFITRITQFRSLEQFFDWLLPQILKIRELGHSKGVSNAQLYLNKAQISIEENFRDPSLTIEKVCEDLGISVSYLSLLFKKEWNTTYIKVLTKVRIDRAKDLLDHSDMKIADIADSCGFSDVSYFSHSFKKQTGVSPRVYREKTAD